MVAKSKEARERRLAAKRRANDIRVYGSVEAAAAHRAARIDARAVRPISKWDDPEYKAKAYASRDASFNRTRQWLAQYKINNGCVDCGYNKSPVALQFDHIEDKTKNVSEIRTLPAAKREVMKCVVRCANCHAVVTHARQVEKTGKNNMNHFTPPPDQSGVASSLP